MYPPNPYGNQPQQHVPPPQGNAASYPGYPPASPASPPYPPAAGLAPGYPPTPGYSSSSSSPYPQATGQAVGYPPAPGFTQAPGFAPHVYPQPVPAPYPVPVLGQPQYPQQAYGAASPTGGYSVAYPGQPIPNGYPAQAPYAAASGSQLGSSAGVGEAFANARMQLYQEIPTIIEGNIDAAADAQALRKAMKGFGTDEATIINILAKRTFRQRQQIAQAFKTEFGKDLCKKLKSELSGKFEDVILSLMTPKFEFIAKKLKKAISGIGTDERALIDILCTSTNNEIREINAAYQRLFGKALESEITGDTSGHFRRLLVSLNSAGRSEDSCADPRMATQDAQALYKAGEKRLGTDESTFNLILATRSLAQIRLMLHEYERITGHSLEKAIQSEFSGEIRNGLLAVVKCARNRAAYFAERLHDCLAGIGTNNDDLIFTVVTRAEVDIENIKQEYNKMYQKSLAHDISGDTSGDYKKVLLALIGT